MPQAHSDRQALIRRQYLVTPENVEKINEIAKMKNFSATEVVRHAIDAYNPDEQVSQSDLLELVAERLKATIKDTAQTREKMEKTIARLSRNV